MAPSKRGSPAKNYIDSGGSPPKSFTQDASPLLSKNAPRSDALARAGSPAAAAAKRQPIGSRSGSNMVIQDDSSAPISFSKYVTPACCAIAVLALMAVAYAATYLTRDDEDTPELTAVEKSLGIYAVVESFVPWWFGSDSEPETCKDGLLITGPVQTPANAALFLTILLWMFLAVAIVADLFMEAIEAITSQETTTRTTLPNGRTKSVTSRVWNPTVANLTLMALGSSSPEILLSIIEIVSSGFYAGELGPSTIVGSAAFNLMVISAVCVMAIPNGEGRYIKDTNVFYMTATWSILAYIWLYVILVIATPDIVTMFEGVFTFVLFFIFVQLSYMTDIGAFNNLSFSALYRRCCRGQKVSDARMRHVETSSKPTAATQKTYAAYRIGATREATGAATREDKAKEFGLSLPHENLNQKSLDNKGVFEFAHSKVMCNAASTAFEPWVDVHVVRHGGVLAPASVSYTCTEGGGTVAKGIIEFGPGQLVSNLRFEISEEDKAKPSSSVLFTVELSAPSAGNMLGAVTMCAARIKDGNAPGVFVLNKDFIEVPEHKGSQTFKVRRIDGSRGKVSCRVSTQDGTAIAPNDYEPIVDQLLEFDDGVTERSVTVNIVNDSSFEGDEDFKLIFSGAEGGARFSEECNGGPDRALATINIKCDDAQVGCEGLLVRLGINADEMEVVGFSWRAQFDDVIRYDGESPIEALLYVLAMPWRFICAFAPPPRLHGGWTCFWVVLSIIGILTAVIGDVAAHLGCCMGIKASTTAITLVAMGTSLPDTFASKTAAANEEYADASIGNITGSNSVNVFLGLGLPWAMAAVYWGVLFSPAKEASWRARYSEEPWYSPGMPVAFAVPAGDLGYSVGVFLICGTTTLAVLLLRRAVLGFEIGGPPHLAMLTAGFLVLLWFLYIALCVTK